MDGFEKRRNDKKEIIMQTAIELFNKYGFEKVPMTEIAEKAHVSKVSIYNFFGSKDNLRRIIIKNIIDKSLEETKTLVKKECNFIDKMREYLEDRIIYGNQHDMEFFFNAVESDTVLRQYFDDFNIENKRLISSLIKEGKKAGYFSADISDKFILISSTTIFSTTEKSAQFLSVIPILWRRSTCCFLTGSSDIRRNSYPAIFM